MFCDVHEIGFLWTGFLDEFDRIVDLAEPHNEGVQLLSTMWPDQKYIVGI